MEFSTYNKNIDKARETFEDYEKSINKATERGRYVLLFSFLPVLFSIIPSWQENIYFYFISIFPTLFMSIIFSFFVFILNPSYIRNGRESLEGYAQLFKTYDDLLHLKYKRISWAISFLFVNLVASSVGIYLLVFNFELINNLIFQLFFLVTCLAFTFFLRRKWFKGIIIEEYKDIIRKLEKKS